MTYQSLIEELNQVRSTQKSLNDFSSIAEWLAYGSEMAIKKAVIFKKMELLNKETK